jgi:hypothetical protein
VFSVCWLNSAESMTLAQVQHSYKTLFNCYGNIYTETCEARLKPKQKYGLQWILYYS